MIDLYCSAFRLVDCSNLNDKRFGELVQEYRERLNDSEIAILIASLLLLTSELHRSLPVLPTSEVHFKYNPTRRRLFREIVGLFLTYVDPAYFCNIAERKVAKIFADKNISAHLPSELEQEVAAVGAEEYYRQATSSTFRQILTKAAGRISSLYTSDPRSTHIPLSFTYTSLQKQPALNVTIAIGGWMEEDRKWQGLQDYRGMICSLIWNNGSLTSYATKGTVKVLQVAPSPETKDFAVATSSLIAAETLTGCAVLASAGVLASGLVAAGVGISMDIATAREKAAFTGKQLAVHIGNQQFGKVPVTLIGFSMGCQVIYDCLKELHRRTSKYYIQDVILVGGAVPNLPLKWGCYLSHIGGRAINVYSAHDEVLRYIYQTPFSRSVLPIGLGPVLCPRMENFDASQYVTCHLDHCSQLAYTLARVGFQN